MPQLPETPTANFLSRTYAEAELAMQSADLEWQGHDHGLQIILRQGKQTAQIKIFLTEGHYMVLRPVDRGAGGCASWVSFTEPSADSKASPYLIRAWVEVVNRKSRLSDNDKKSESFTIQGDSLKSVVIGALQHFAKLTGKLLMPIFVGDK